MARKKRPTQIVEESPFLNLPPEIREEIYCTALVRRTPIDLSPMNYTLDEETQRVFRLQEDLEFVRKEMATGLFRTCKQIFHEGGSIFWSKNTFRFSGDLYWFDARRFLGTIGPGALSQLQSLELFAPLGDLNCLHTAPVDPGHWSWRSRIYKNKPKMHMVKARSEPWARNSMNSSYRGGWRAQRERLKSKSMLTSNVEHVCYLLETAKTSLELKLVLPGGFGLMLPPRPHRSSHLWGVPDPWPRNLDLQLPQELLRIIPLFTRKVTLVLEAGAKLMSLEMPEQFTNKGINVLCQPGSIFNYDPAQLAIENEDAKLWINPHARFDYLIGFPALFEPEQRIEVPALGGRATTTPGTRSTARVLKGFGGCRFIDQDVWSCSGCCPYKPGIWDKKSMRFTGSGYIHNPRKPTCSVQKQLVIKKRGRAARNGVVGLVEVSHRQ